jgi:dienelactone hydrolase
MDTPIWLKPALFGAAGGAIALAIVGFSWGGWVTGGTANRMAADQAKLEVVAALVPICIENSQKDPMTTEKLAEMKNASSYDRSNLLMKAGWATMPGATEPNRNVASACMTQLAAQF